MSLPGVTIAIYSFLLECAFYAIMYKELFNKISVPFLKIVISIVYKIKPNRDLCGCINRLFWALASVWV